LATDAAAIPPYEQELRAFLRPRGVDLDAQAVVFQLYRTSSDVIAAMEAAALRRRGLSHAGFALLMTLWVSGPREVRTLARIHHLSKPSIVSAIGTLERAGLVRRQRAREDRRLVRVTLTAAGRRLIDRAQAALHRCERILAGGLAPAEQRQLASWLRQIGDVARSGALAEET